MGTCNQPVEKNIFMDALNINTANNKYTRKGGINHHDYHHHSHFHQPYDDHDGDGRVGGVGMLGGGRRM